MLLLVYCATLAPDVTFWDAGELISAIHVFGIPHPPGTPLYVAIGRAWTLLLFFVPTALATNLLSAVATAAAVGALAYVASRRMGAVVALAAALSAGGMSSVWLNATETEVYSVSLLASAAILLAAGRAGRLLDWRAAALTCYLVLLAPALHLTALVVAPAAITLVAWGESDEPAAVIRTRRNQSLAIGAAVVLSFGAGTASVAAMGAGLLIAVAAAWLANGERRRLALALLPGAVAVTAYAILLLRAAHAPPLNQGDPSTLSALIEVISREQYAAPPVLPRQAPAWLQLGNIIQYADWQVALGLAHDVAPSLARTLATVAFVALALAGARWQHRVDAQAFRALVVILIAGTIGVALYLNLRAGPTIGIGILPPDAEHEPRERDYFFVPGFIPWGIWAGMGAVRLVQHLVRSALTLRTAAVPAVALAALPIALNWMAVDRRREPEASLPRAFAAELLVAVPEHGVLFLRADNDTYPVWYAQHVLGLRNDVVAVTLPMLPAEWYRHEIFARLHSDAEITPGDVSRQGEDFSGVPQSAARVAEAARSAGRPVSAAITVEPELREAIGDGWVLRGLVFAEAPLRAGEGESFPQRADLRGLSIDFDAAAKSAARVAHLLSPEIPPGTDPTARSVQRLMRCPLLALNSDRRAPADSLATLCNYR